MHLNDHSLFQIDEEYIRRLEANDSEALINLTINLLEDLVEARNRLNQNPSNSSRPSGSMPPWESGKTDPEEKSPSDDTPKDVGDDEITDSPDSDDPPSFILRERKAGCTLKASVRAKVEY